MTRVWLLGAFVAGSVACGDKRAPGVASAEGGETTASNGGKLAQGGSTAPSAGQAAGGVATADAGEANAAGETSSAGAGGSGTVGTGAVGGSGEDPLPPVGNPPLCAHGATHGTPTLLTLSGAGDELLQGLTPDELSIAWKKGNDYFVADRLATTDAFAAPLQVTGGSQFSAVSLSGDGLTLVAVTPNLTVTEMVREPGEAFDAADASAGAFGEFNTTIASIPTAGQVLSDAVVSSEDTSFFFSYFVSGSTGGYATVQEGPSSGGVWSFASLDLGKLLYATDAKRRIPTGVSVDRLTLFYRDQVKGDFRAAWRINPLVQFDYSESLALGTGTMAAAPNGACSRIYFSAQGANSVDLFFSDVTN